MTFDREFSLQDPASSDHGSARKKASDSSPQIAIERVTVDFSTPRRRQVSTVRAVDDVSLKLPAGRITALVGPSGCGKTTLLRAIAGLQRPTSGTVATVPAAARRDGDVAFVFQQPALLPWRTALENVMLPLTLLGKSTTGSMDAAARRRLAVDALSEVDLSDAIDRLPHQLSGGMQMRVSIARALVTRPTVLLLDEPFAALDDMLRTQLGELVLGLWNEHQFTTVLVTHNIAEAVLLSHDIVVMHNGRCQTPWCNRLPWPRHDDQRRTPEFGDCYGMVSDRLRVNRVRGHESNVPGVDG